MSVILWKLEGKRNAARKNEFPVIGDGHWVYEILSQGKAQMTKKQAVLYFML